MQILELLARWEESSMVAVFKGHPPVFTHHQGGFFTDAAAFELSTFLVSNPLAIFLLITPIKTLIVPPNYTFGVVVILVYQDHPFWDE